MAMNEQISSKLYDVSTDIVQTVNALSLIMDSLFCDRDIVSKDASAATASYLCRRLDLYFSAYDMLFNRLQDIASTIEGIAVAPLEGEVSAHG